MQRDRSTWTLLMCLAGMVRATLLLGVCTYAVLSVPLDDRSRMAIGGTWYRHGWPFPFLTRSSESDAGPLGIWSYFNGFSWWLAIADIGIGIALSLSAFLLFAFLARLAKAVYNRRIASISAWGLWWTGMLGCAAVVTGYHLISDWHIDQKAASEIRSAGFIVYVAEGAAVPEPVDRVLVDLHIPGRRFLQRAVHVEWQATGRGADVAATHPDIVLRRLADSLRAVKWCDSVDLKDSRLTDVGVKELCEHLPACKFLRLEGSRSITNVSLQRISKAWPDIQVLELDGSSITDDGLGVLLSNRDLNEVAFCNTNTLTADGVIFLSGMAHIEHINVDVNVLSEEQFFSIRNRRPRLSLGFGRW